MPLNKAISCIGLIFLFWNSDLWSNEQTPPIQLFTKQPQQGSLIVGRALIDGEVYYQAKALPLTETGEFVIGVGRDAPETIELSVVAHDQAVKFPISIAQRQWKIEKVDGLPPSKVSPMSKEVLLRIKREANLVKQARAVFSEQNAFLMPFIEPAKGRISGVYGSQRVLNGKPKRPHFGLDIANNTGTRVNAPIDGVITLAEKDLFYSGGTVIIDHGLGVSSTYLHLSQINVSVGQTVKQGQKLGEIGQTGRATGPHLDWRLNWLNVRLDPALMLNK